MMRSGSVELSQSSTSLFPYQVMAAICQRLKLLLAGTRSGSGYSAMFKPEHAPRVPTDEDGLVGVLVCESPFTPAESGGCVQSEQALEWITECDFGVGLKYKCSTRSRARVGAT